MGLIIFGQENMLILTRKCLQKCILITFTIVLLTQLTKEYFLWESYGKTNKIVIDFWLVEEGFGCSFKQRNVSFVLPNCQNYQTGSEIRVIGSLSRVSDRGFFAQKRLKIEEVVLLRTKPNSVMWWFLISRQMSLDIKEALINSVMGYFPLTYLDLMTAMVFGGGDTLPPDLNHHFKVTGTLHIMAVSGFNIAMVSGIVSVFTARFGRFQSFLVWTVAVSFYVLCTDLSASVLRAFLMAFVKKVGSTLVQKTYHNLQILTTAALLILLLKPAYLVSISFQLSIAATFGITLFMPVLGENDPAVEKVDGFSVWNVLSESFTTTLSAQIFTVPISLYYFSELSLLSLVSNVFLLWLTPIISIGGLAWMIFSWLFSLVPGAEILAKLVGLFLYVIIKVFTQLVGLFAQFNSLYLENITFGWQSLILSWFLCLVIYKFLFTRSEQAFKAAHSAYHL